jgi:outer membrane lipoprotein-sorting protein
LGSVRAALILLPLVLVASGCAARRVRLPTDTGTPLPDIARVHAEVSSACAGVRTLTAELALAGRVEGERVRGRVIAGLARPLAMRLEGVAPFGPPAFILAAHDGEAVLLLPRDRRVVRETNAARLLDALVGLALEPDDLRAILTGCVVPAPRPVRGTAHEGGWAVITLEGGATVYVRQEGSQWILRAARRDNWLLEYGAWQGGFPRSVRLTSAQENSPVDLTATIAQLMTNVDLPANAFTVDVPGDTEAMSLDELRRQGSLRQR